MIALNNNPTAHELRGFTRIWFPLLVVVAGSMLQWRFGYPLAATAVWAIGAAIEAAMLASAQIARVVFVAILTATYPIGVVTSTIVLAVLFYLVFTPIGWGMRLAGRDRLRLRARGEDGHWQRYLHDDDPQRAFRQF